MLGVWPVLLGTLRYFEIVNSSEVSIFWKNLIVLGVWPLINRITLPIIVDCRKLADYPAAAVIIIPILSPALEFLCFELTYL